MDNFSHYIFPGAIVIGGFLYSSILISKLARYGLEKREHWIRESNIKLPLKEYPRDQPWRHQPIDIPFVERLRQLALRQEQNILHSYIASEFLPKSIHDIPAAIMVHSALNELSWKLSLWYFPPCKYTNEMREQYYATCSQLDRLWNGNSLKERGDLNVEIQKLQRRRKDLTSVQKDEALAMDEEIIDLERDLSDLIILEERSKITSHEANFKDSKTRRVLDVKSEVFDIFEGPFLKEVEIRQKYNEKISDIRNSRTLTDQQKTELIHELDKRFNEYVQQDKKKSPIPLYRKES